MAGTDPKAPHGADNVEVEHEHSDVNVRAILWFTGGLTLAAVVIHVGIWALFAFFVENSRGTDIDRRPLAIGELQRPPEPRLQALPWKRDDQWAPPRVDLSAMRAAEDRRLKGYGWIDRGVGTVHIPVERAIELIAERGLPTRTMSPADAAPTGIRMPTDSASGRDSRALQTGRDTAAQTGGQP
jgi:hypothetical protein